MKIASKIMYKIGRVFNIIEFVAFIIIAVSGAIFLITGTSVNDDSQVSGLGLLIFGIVAAIISYIVLRLATKSIKALDNKKVENKPHIIMIVIGVISEDWFYILGGIFGLIAENS